MKHIHTFESFLNEANKTGEKITLKGFTDIDHSRLVKWMSSEFGPMKYNPGMEWVGGHLTKGGDFTLDVSGWNARDLKDLKAYLKSQHHVFESVNEAKTDELSLGDTVEITDKNYVKSAKVSKGTIVEIQPGGMLIIDTTRGQKTLHPDMVTKA